MPKTVLVADDDDTSREEVMRALLRAGYAVLSAWSGVEAVLFLSEKKVDLLVIDPEMRGGQGMGVLQHVSRDPRLSHLPVLVLSRRDARLSNEWAIMFKPFLPEQLAATVRAMMGRPAPSVRKPTPVPATAPTVLEGLRRSAVDDGPGARPSKI
jgi:DNA-binding response OmpR family regulator